ncbi:MAG TPA: hypothetical protein VLE02_01325 [Nitrosarchaeum sp.]|nr:hypothetical protein [Nitrosarchaeum sp.]
MTFCSRCKRIFNGYCFCDKPAKMCSCIFAYKKACITCGKIVCNICINNELCDTCETYECDIEIPKISYECDIEIPKISYECNKCNQPIFSSHKRCNFCTKSFHKDCLVKCGNDACVGKICDAHSKKCVTCNKKNCDNCMMHSKCKMCKTETKLNFDRCDVCYQYDKIHFIGNVCNMCQQ